MAWAAGSVTVPADGRVADDGEAAQPAARTAASAAKPIVRGDPPMEKEHSVEGITAEEGADDRQSAGILQG